MLNFYVIAIINCKTTSTTKLFRSYWRRTCVCVCECRFYSFSRQSRWLFYFSRLVRFYHFSFHSAAYVCPYDVYSSNVFSIYYYHFNHIVFKWTNTWWLCGRLAYHILYMYTYMQTILVSLKEMMWDLYVYVSHTNWAFVDKHFNDFQINRTERHWLVIRVTAHAKTSTGEGTLGNATMKNEPTKEEHKNDCSGANIILLPRCLFAICANNNTQNQNILSISFTVTPNNKRQYRTLRCWDLPMLLYSWMCVRMWFFSASWVGLIGLRIMG